MPRSLWPFIALSCSPLLWAQQSDVDRAWELAAQGQQEQAIRVLGSVISNEPRNADARLLFGSLLSERGNAPEAIAQLTEAVKLRPQSADAQNALGEAYIAAGDVPRARRPFETAVSLKPDFAAAQSNLGAVLLQAGEVAAAARHLDRAIALFGRDPEAASAHYLRAKAYSATADPKNAARELEVALTLRNSYPEAWSDLGQARKLLLDEPGALAALNRAVELNPGDAVAQYRLGAEYLRQEQLSRAVEHLQAAYQLNSRDQSILNALQTALRQSGKTQEAALLKRELSKLLRQKDESSQNQLIAVKLNNEATELEKAGNLQLAVEKYQRAASLYPSHIGIRVNLAVGLLKLGKWTAGLSEMHEALTRDPGNEQIRSALQDALKQAPPGTVPNW